MTSKLIETKSVDLSGYSAVELLYLMQDILGEVSDRDLKINKIQSEMDKKLSVLYHEIEFNEFTATERTKMFSDLKSHLQKRRMAKNELFAISRLNTNVNIPQTYGKIGRIISESQSQMHLESGQPVYPQGSFSRFYRDYMSTSKATTVTEEAAS